jgi:hypothetical protein
MDSGEKFLYFHNKNLKGLSGLVEEDITKYRVYGETLHQSLELFCIQGTHLVGETGYEKLPDSARL